MKWFICVGILLVKFRACHTLCPPPHLYQTVGSQLCKNNTDYHCLYEGQTKSSQPYCFKAEIFTAGTYVLYEGGLNAKPCPVNRYQPVPYLSHQYSECAYSKSDCSEEGQVMYDFGSTERDPTENDRACRCDYREGYDFVSKPRNKCFCIPSEEDCSCIVKPCPSKLQRLTPDYECLTSTRLITCPVIPSKQDKDRKERDEEEMFHYNDKTYNEIVKTDIRKLVICGAIAGMVLLLVVIGIGIVLCHKAKPMERGQSTIWDFSENPNFIGSSGFRRCSDVLTKFNFVVIKGRFGTGKTTLAHQLALQYKDHNKITIITKYNIDQFMSVKPSNEKQVVIFDEVCTLFDRDERQNKVGELMESFLTRDTSVIITVGEFDHTLIRFLRNRSIISDETMIDLHNDTPMSKKEKLLMLNAYLRQQNMKSKDLNLEVFHLSEEESDKIAMVNTFFGFPYLCAEFCKHSWNFQLGVKFFKQPPIILIKEIERIYTSRNRLDDSNSRIIYMILVYILLCNDGFIDVNALNATLLREIKGYYFQIKKPEDELVSYLLFKDTSLERYVLRLEDGKFSLHPSVYQAMILSFAKCNFAVIVQKCKLEDLLDLIRPPGYKELQNEIVLVCSKDQYNAFCKAIPKRLALASLTDKDGVHLVCRYITKSKSKHLLVKYLNELQNQFGTYRTSQRVQLMIEIFKYIAIDNKLFLELNASTFNIVWALLVYTKYNTTLFDDLVRTTVSKGDKPFVRDMLCTLIDEHDNNMLTYCTLWWETSTMQALIAVLSEMMSVKHSKLSIDRLFKSNIQGISSIHFAAYYGRYNCLAKFLALKSKGLLENKIDASYELRDEIRDLIELTKQGERGLTCKRIQLNTNICVRIEKGTNDEFARILKILEKEI